ncbi:MAG TPA: DUF1697 domain-containing protein [Sphingomicrobium sp.]|nr:DUF1697 domain-containing protein [Sphingomicrobium sp.]
MIRYVALLRGVNLGGRCPLRMIDLKTIADELSLGAARTFLASGNVLLTSNRTEDSLRNELEKHLRQHMARDVRVVLRTADALENVVAGNPFTNVASSAVQVFFLNEAPPANLLETVTIRDDERIATGTREVYVAYGERGIGRSRLHIPAAETGTARNMNTVARLAELAREM